MFYFASWVCDLNVIIMFFFPLKLACTRFVAASFLQLLAQDDPATNVCHPETSTSARFSSFTQTLSSTGSLIYSNFPQSCRCLYWDHGSSLGFENITQSLWPIPMQHLEWLQLPSRSAYTFQLALVCNGENNPGLILHSSDSIVFIFHLRIYSVFHQKNSYSIYMFCRDICYFEVDLKKRPTSFNSCTRFA